MTLAYTQENINLCLEMNVIVNLYEKEYNISHKE